MGRIIVCGLGQVGYRVADLLLRLGEDVTVVTLAVREDFLEDVRKRGARVILSDARSDHVLLDAGLAGAGAIIACTDSDLVNVEIALDSGRLAPGVRVVVRTFDQTLARGLESSLGIHRALAMSVLAAPAFASAALGETMLGMFTWRGKAYAAVASDDPKRPFAFRSFEPPVAKPSRWSLLAWLRKTGTALSEGWQTTHRLLRFLACMVPLLAIASVGVFRYALDLSPVDAFYFVVTTLTTTGYGDISVKDASPWLKIYASILMLVGSAAIATLYSLITDFLVSSRFNELTGRRAVLSRDHVIVVGLGSVGFSTVNTLREMGAKVAVIDAEANTNLRQLLSEGVAFVVGDGRDGETLDLAGMENARALIAATDDDTINLSIGLTARALNPDCQVVVRLFDALFAAKVERIGITQALSSAGIAAPGYVVAALYEDAVYGFVCGSDLVVVRPGKDGELSADVRRLDK